MANVTIDGKQYDSDKLPEEAKSQLQMMQFVDSELQRLAAQSAALQTARVAYGKRLNELLAVVEKLN